MGRGLGSPRPLRLGPPSQGQEPAPTAAPALLGPLRRLSPLGATHSCPHTRVFSNTCTRAHTPTPPMLPRKHAHVRAHTRAYTHTEEGPGAGGQRRRLSSGPILRGRPPRVPFSSLPDCVPLWPSHLRRPGRGRAAWMSPTETLEATGFALLSPVRTGAVSTHCQPPRPARPGSAHPHRLHLATCQQRLPAFHLLQEQGVALPPTPLPPTASGSFHHTLDVSSLVLWMGSGGIWETQRGREPRPQGPRRRADPD